MPDLPRKSISMYMYYESVTDTVLYDILYVYNWEIERDVDRKC